MEAGEAGAIEAILKAINTHIKDGAVCNNGCGALWNITLVSKPPNINPHNSFNLPPPNAQTITKSRRGS